MNIRPLDVGKHYAGACDLEGSEDCSFCRTTEGWVRFNVKDAATDELFTLALCRSCLADMGRFAVNLLEHGIEALQ